MVNYFHTERPFITAKAYRETMRIVFIFAFAAGIVVGYAFKAFVG